MGEIDISQMYWPKNLTFHNQVQNKRLTERVAETVMARPQICSQLQDYYIHLAPTNAV